MTLSSFPPGAILALGALLIPFATARYRTALLIGLPLLTLSIVWSLPDGSSTASGVLGYQLIWVSSDALGRLFAIIFSLMAFGGALFALRQQSRLELTAAFVYAGCAVGVALAGDLISLFIFWETMAIASTLILLASRTDRAVDVAVRYFLVHMFGGALLMAGIALHIINTGSTELSELGTSTMSGWLILVGVLINAAAPPLSGWLADAYPEGSYSGTVFLSAFTTKAAVYVLIRGFAGTEILIAVGLFMIFYGIIYALLENDMRRILAYSIVNQVGFMVTGVGIGTEMALNGAAAHAFAHIIYKALLLMSAGSVLYQTGKRKCTDLGGLFQSMPLTTICGIIGALAISATPWTSGFVSKSMINQSAADQHLMVVWFALLAASAGVFLHAGIKFPWFVFFQKDSGLRPTDPPWHMCLAMAFFAALCVGIGVFPNALYALLPYPVEYEPYTGAHVVNMLQLLLFSGLAFFLLLPLMKRTLTISVDTDYLYRRVWPAVYRRITNAASATRIALYNVANARINGCLRVAERYFGRTRQADIAQMITIAISMLLAILLIGYVLR
ncbi:MAG: Na(+)/H(+) antiporter subunit D [Gammaproteobacteria bacterium]|nr:Na(+)/H(+) antiporter subunit D [Gammaproteobacteria bacterium]